MILAIDSASAACTAALLTGDGELIAERHEEIGRGHAERLMPMVAELIGQHIPTQILVGVGPGSFTGLRVAIAAAHGMAIGWSVPLVRVRQPRARRCVRVARGRARDWAGRGGDARRARRMVRRPI